jgi:hypothetical protein
MLIREMTISDADCIWRHPHLHTDREVALASAILNLADEFHLDDEGETFDDVKAERDGLQTNYDYVCQQVDRQDEIIAEQDDLIENLNEKIFALSVYIDNIFGIGTTAGFTKQHYLWRD